MKRVLSLIAGLAALLVLTAAPAGAGSVAQAAHDPLCVSQFSSLSQLAPAPSGARGKGMREPVLRLGPRDSEIPGDDAAHKGGLIGIDIPVWIHVVTDGAAGRVSDATIAQQLAILNLAFSGFYGGADTGFRFWLKGVDRTNNPAWYAAGPDTAEEREMKKALKRGGPATLNLYTTSGELYLGWAYFPKIVSTPDRVLDGVVIDYRSMPGGEYGTRLLTRPDLHTRGRTLARPLPHLRPRLPRAGRPHRRHAVRARAHERLPRGQGHLPQAGPRSDPQLHGLLLRHLLRGVHERPVRPHEPPVRALARARRLIGSARAGR